MYNLYGQSKIIFCCMYIYHSTMSGCHFLLLVDRERTTFTGPAHIGSCRSLYLVFLTKGHHQSVCMACPDVYIIHSPRNRGLIERLEAVSMEATRTSQLTWQELPTVRCREDSRELDTPVPDTGARDWDVMHPDMRTIAGRLMRKAWVGTLMDRPEPTCGRSRNTSDSRT